MANPFDAFDQTTADAAPTAPAANPFDKIDPQQSAEPPDQKPNVIGDTIRGAGKGILEGAGNMLGMPADVVHMVDKYSRALLTKGATSMGLMSPEFAQRLNDHLDSNDVTQQARSDAINSHLMNLAQSAGLDTSAPKTIPGQYAETIGQFLPAAATMGGAGTGLIKAGLKYGVLPAVASETAGQAFKGTGAEPYARVAGALGTQLPGAAMSALERIALGKPAAAPTEQALQSAQGLLDDSRAAGAPLTVPEAVQKATGSATRLGDIQRVVEQSPQGGAIMKNFYAQRPGQVDALGRSTFDQIGAQPADPYSLPGKVQAASQGVVDQAGADRSAAVNALYKRAAPDNVPQSNMQAIIDHIDGMIADDKTGIIAPKLEELKSRLTTTAPPEAVQTVPPSNAPNSPPGIIADRQRKPESLVDFLISKGGVQDQGGDLNAIGADAVHQRGAGRLVNPKGVPPDYAREAAEEAGFLPPNSTIPDLYNSLAEHIAGRPQYRISDQAAATLHGADARASSMNDMATEHYGSIVDDTAAQAGLRLSPAERDHATQVAMQGSHPEDAIRDALQSTQESALQKNAAASGQGSLGVPPAQAAMADRVPITDIANLDRARKYFRDQIGQPSISADAIPKEVAGKVGDVLGNLRSAMVDASPNFAAGKNLYQKITESQIDPLLASPTGQLAATDKFPAQSKILFNSNPLPNSQGAVGQAVRQVAKADPDAAQSLVRSHLEQTFNEATQNLQSGPNQFGGAGFAKIVAGNSQQAANLEAAVRALPDGATRWAALRKSMDIMEAMGTRQPMGSPTEFNAQMNKLLQEGHPGAAAIATAASPAEWPSFAYKMYQRLSYNQNTGKLADLFTTGDVKDLRSLVGAKPNSLRAQAMFLGALGKRASNTGQSPPPEQSSASMNP